MSNIQKILVAVDNSSTSEKVALKALQLGHQLKAKIALISVVDPSPVSVGTGIDPRNLTHMIKDEYAQHQKELIETIFHEHSVSSFLEEGFVSKKILEVADQWNADFIVIGTHGKTGLLELLAGSVAKDVIKNSTKPLFLVPSK